MASIADLMEKAQARDVARNKQRLEELRNWMLAARLTSAEVADLFQAAMLVHINGSNYSGIYTGIKLDIYNRMVEVLEP